MTNSFKMQEVAHLNIEPHLVQYWFEIPSRGSHNHQLHVVLKSVSQLLPRANKAAGVLTRFYGGKGHYVSSQLSRWVFSRTTCLAIHLFSYCTSFSLVLLNKSFGENPSETPAYIMTLATIEPRKNTRGLIRAWQQLRDRFKHDVKLMIVGTPGWDFEPILHEMRLYVDGRPLAS